MSGHVSEHFNILLVGDPDDIDAASKLFGKPTRTVKFAKKEFHLEIVKGPKGEVKNMAEECKNIDEVMICIDLSRPYLHSDFFKAVKKAQEESYCRVVIVGILPEGKKRQIDREEIKELMVVNGITKGIYSEVDKNRETPLLELTAEKLYRRKQKIQGNSFMKTISEYKVNKREERNALRALCKYITLTVLNQQSPSESQYIDIMLEHMPVLNKGELGKRFEKFIDNLSLATSNDVKFAQKNCVLISRYFEYQLRHYRKNVKRKDKQNAATALMNLINYPTDAKFIELITDKNMEALSNGRLGEMFEDIVFKRGDFFKQVPNGKNMQEHLQKYSAIYQLKKYQEKRKGETPWFKIFSKEIKQDKIEAAADLIKAIDEGTPIEEVIKKWNIKNKKVFKSSDRLGRLLLKFNKPNYSIFEREIPSSRAHRQARH